MTKSFVDELLKNIELLFCRFGVDLALGYLLSPLATNYIFILVIQKEIKFFVQILLLILL